MNQSGQVNLSFRDSDVDDSHNIHSMKRLAIKNNDTVCAFEYLGQAPSDNQPDTEELHQTCVKKRSVDDRIGKDFKITQIKPPLSMILRFYENLRMILYYFL